MTFLVDFARQTKVNGLYNENEEFSRNSQKVFSIGKTLCEKNCSIDLHVKRGVYPDRKRLDPNAAKEFHATDSNPFPLPSPTRPFSFPFALLVS